MAAEFIKPPQWPLRILKAFLKREYCEEIEGDMEEIFYENLQRMSQPKAKWLYTWDMLKLFRPNLIRSLGFTRNFYPIIMFKNYFKVSIRSLRKTPVNSFINVFGLSIAISICVFTYAFARWTFSTDQFHEHKNEVFLVTYAANRDGEEQLFGDTPRPIGEHLAEDFPQVSKMCRVEDRTAVIKHNDNAFHERLRYTDATFLEMFTFPLKWGTAASLRDLNSIILSEDISTKYFGYENPVGQSIRVIFSQGNFKEFKITGVAAEFPKAITIQFDFLLNIENLKLAEPGYNFEDWASPVNATFIQLRNADDVPSITQQMEKYRKLQNTAAPEDWAIRTFSLEPLATLHERSEYIRNDISRSSHNNYVSVMFNVGISIFLLLLASFNYINIAIVTAARRLKEIGIRKCIGATRRSMVVQFLSENLVMTCFALIAGIILAYTFFIPGFETLWTFDMDFNLLDPNLWIYLPIVVLVTSIVSGIYPSLYISKFQVVSILKGSVMFGRRNPLTKILLGFQLIMACVFITASVMFAQNNNYLSHRSWGYNQADAFYVKVPDENAFRNLSDLMQQHPDVVSIAGSADHIGRSHSTAVIHLPDREYEVDKLAVDAHYLQALELPLKSGRNFNEQEGSDQHSVLVTELMAKNLGWADPLGKQFRMDSLQYEVIGVVGDFHSFSFSKKMKPIIFTRAQEKDFNYLTIKARTNTEVDTYKALQSNWSKLYPETPFEGSLQEDVWGFYYETIKIYDLVWKVFATLAVTLAALGLYGMVRLNIEGRVKEFSIRKVLGAGLTSLTHHITTPFTVLFASTLFIGAPLGYAFGKWIIEFANPYHMPITPSGVSIAVLIVILVLIFTISTQIIKVVKNKPIDGLKAD